MRGCQGEAVTIVVGLLKVTPRSVYEYKPCLVPVRGKGCGLFVLAWYDMGGMPIRNRGGWSGRVQFSLSGAHSPVGLTKQ